MRQYNVTEQFPGLTRRNGMERWNSWFINDMPTTDNVQTTASNNIQRQIPSDYQLLTQNRRIGSPISEKPFCHKLIIMLTLHHQYNVLPV